MTPHYQGSIDALCGIYSLINATRLVIYPSRCKPRLLSRCVAALSRKKGSADFINQGTDITDLAFLLKEIFRKEYSIHTSKPFHKRSKVPLEIFWNTIDEFLHAPHRAVVILIHTYHRGHWSVVSEATANKLVLFDSNRTRNLNRKYCTTSDITATRTRLLFPTMSYFIQRS